jgi:citrate lyase beta subunit
MHKGETMNLAETFADLKDKHEKMLQQTRINEQIRMLECVRALLRQGTISQEAAELLALEIGMGWTSSE